MNTTIRTNRTLIKDKQVDLFIDCIVAPENQSLTVQQICGINEIDPTTLYSKLRNLEIRKSIKERLELLAFIETPAIYRALIKKAKDGNTSAIELFLARFEGFRKIDANQVNVIVNPEEEKRKKEAVLAYLDRVKSNALPSNLKDNDSQVVIVEGNEEDKDLIEYGELDV
jgi:hypothetical protein